MTLKQSIIWVLSQPEYSQGTSPKLIIDEITTGTNPELPEVGSFKEHSVYPILGELVKEGKVEKTGANDTANYKLIQG